MNQDSVAGTAKNLGGKVQEGVGRLTGDTKTQVEGIVNQASGAAEDLYGQAKESASDATKSVRQSAVGAEDHIRHFIETRPYATALMALCVGWVMGRRGRHD